MPVSKKLLVVVLDAANPELLRTWAADGTLPNISRLMETGLVGDTRSVDGLLDGATWPSFYTAVNPARYGFYWLDQVHADSYRVMPSRPATFARRPALWEVLSDAGRRVLVMDVPLSRKSPRLNGIQILEWGSHDAIFGFQTRPRRLKRAILRAVGPHPAPEPCDAEGRSGLEYRQFAQQLVQGAAARARITRQLLTEEPWDFAIQVFRETHCAGHQLWHLHDPRHPGFDSRATAETGDLLRVVYSAVDAAVGEIISGLDSGTTIVLLDLHGMSYSYGLNLLMPEILTRLGAMTCTLPDTVNDSVAQEGGVVGGLRAAYHRLPKGVRQPVHDLRQYLNRRWLGRGTPMALVPHRSKCFDVAVGGSFAGVRLNLRGREPRGTLSPGAEAEDFCGRLTRELQEIVDPRTGRPLVRRVLRTADLFQGACLDELPDLLVEWEAERPLGSAMVGTGTGAVVQAHSPRIGTVEVVNTSCRSGEHRIEGMFVARGPGITPGSLGRVVSNLDLAPSFAEFLGCTMPDVDGRPIPELLGR